MWLYRQVARGVEPVAMLVRVAAVLVGLANLVVVASLGDSGVPLWTGDVSWGGAVPYVLTVVVAGLVTSEIVLRKFRSSVLAEQFPDRCGTVMAAVCLGGTLMGGLLATTFVVDGELFSGDPVNPSQVLALLVAASFTGTLYGAALGFLEGMLLAAPLAAVLGLFRNEERVEAEGTEARPR